MQFKRIEINTEIECVAVKVWSTHGRIGVINIYNSGLQLKTEQLENLMKTIEKPVIWVWDFNAYSVVWGSVSQDRNGEVLEDLIDKLGLEVLNDGWPTWFQISRGAKSCVDLTFASAELALVGEWDVMDRYTMGSDHALILSRFGNELIKEKINRSERYCYSRARWEGFKIRSREKVGGINGDNIDSWNRSICNMLKKVADECIPKSSGPKEQQLVP